jgi:hypothetical protein
MGKQHPQWRVLVLSLALILVLSCVSLPTGQSTPTATSNSPSNGIGGNGGSDGNSNNGGNGSGGQNASTPVPTPLSTGSPTPSLTPTPTPFPTPAQPGPYVVKQIRSVGGETISGEVCSTSQQFTVTFVTPKVTFTTLYNPQDATHGKLAYAYSIASAGESHDATGDYTISPAGADGTLLLSEQVRDHVVFKGFDGIMPINYSFNLVPSQNTSCP